MKKLFETWRRFISEAEEPPLQRHYPTPPRRKRKPYVAPAAVTPPADEPDFQPSVKMTRRSNIKMSPRGDGLGVKKPSTTNESEETNRKYEQEVSDIAAALKGGEDNAMETEIERLIDTGRIPKDDAEVKIIKKAAVEQSLIFEPEINAVYQMMRSGILEIDDIMKAIESGEGVPRNRQYSQEELAVIWHIASDWLKKHAE
jgi:hypothetical protein